MLYNQQSQFEILKFNQINKLQMQRLQPYRNRIPTHIIKLLDVSSRITLFLVGQNGPLSFVFKDRLQNKYKTTIGVEIKCSCSLNKNDHCIHSLYVLLKIFKVSVDNPIIWQAAYINSELSDIVTGKHTVAPVRQRMNRLSFMMEATNQQQIPSQIFCRRDRQLKYKLKQERVQAMELDEDSVCPICQQQMKELMCLTFCKIGCGNNYHLQCLRVWISHKKNEQGKITCPMCREQFGLVIFEQLKHQEIQFKKKEVIRNNHKYKCCGCGLDNIQTNVHKCIICQKFQLCQPCYLNNKHIKHPFIKSNLFGQWQAADERRKNQLKIKEFINKKRNQSKNKQILQKMRSAQSSPSNLIDYICSSYPYVSKYISDNIDPYKKLNLQAETMQCQKCQSKRMIFLRRFPCGHFIDHQCLKENIRKGIMYCEKDGDKILKGYQNLLQKQKETKYQQQKAELQVDIQFSPMHIEDLLNENLSYSSKLDSFNQQRRISSQTRHIQEINKDQNIIRNSIIINDYNFSRNSNKNENPNIEWIPSSNRSRVPNQPQRRPSKDIRISNLISRNNNKSRSGLPLNILLNSNPSNLQQIEQQPQINQSQNRAIFYRNSQIQTTRVNRINNINPIEERTRRFEGMKLTQSRLPSFSGQNRTRQTDLNQLRNGLLINSQFEDILLRNSNLS